MNPIAKFHSYVVAITVAVMFLVVNLAVKLVPAPNSESIIIGFLVAGFSSLGIYRLFSGLIIIILPKIECLFKFTLGAYYLKGTWGGFVLTKTGVPTIIVEKYEQTLFSITIRGGCD